MTRKRFSKKKHNLKLVCSLIEKVLPAFRTKKGIYFVQAYIYIAYSGLLKLNASWRIVYGFVGLCVQICGFAREVDPTRTNFTQPFCLW